MADDRAQGRGRPHGRPAFEPRPFRGPGPRPEPPAGPLHTLRIRDGEREIEVSGSAAFIRQVLGELHTIWAQLHGIEPPRNPSIRMPDPPKATDDSLEVLGTDSAR